MIKISYIYHSSYIVELEGAYLIFDYFKGKLPEFDKSKKLIVFASHSHKDHFNPKIFNIFPDAFIVLGYDIRLKNGDGSMRYNGLTEEQAQRAHIMRFNDSLTIPLEPCEGASGSIEVYAVKSTDSGVAYIVTAGEDIIYHAGDLNDWCFEEEDKAYNNNMTAMYKQRLKTIKEYLGGRSIDYAFIPMDPRQGNYYARGINTFLSEISVKRVYPMHMWDHYDIMDRYKSEYPNNAERIIDIIRQ